LINSKSPGMKRNHFAIKRVILILLVCLMPISMLAQKVNPDTLNLEQLNLYKHKAVVMRNTGIVLTSCGPVITVVSYYLMQFLETDSFWVPFFTGIASTVVGIPLWAAGGIRMNIGELLTLNFDELNLYKGKAITLRNTGMILTFSGIGLILTGIIAIKIHDQYTYDYSYFPDAAMLVGLASTLAGMPLWAVGSGRKANAELTLQKFSIAPEGSMALGLGMTIRF